MIQAIQYQQVGASRGCLDVKLKNQAGGTIKTRLYVVEGERESLLGKDDAIALGMIKVNPQGQEKCELSDRIRCLTEEKLKPKITDGIVSGGQTQAQTDQEMKKIVEENKAVFQGMGRAKFEPIQIQMRPEAVPRAQGRRPIPPQFEE